MPLSMVKVGTTVCVKEVMGKPELASKLMSLGIFRGTRLKVISSEYNGPMILQIRGSQIALGYQIVSQIRVETYIEEVI